MKSRRLLWHLYPSFLAIAFAVLLAVSWFASSSLRFFYYNQVASFLEQTTRLAEFPLSPKIQSLDFPAVDAICKQVGKAASTRITVILPDGRVIGDSVENPANMKDHSDRPEFQNALVTGLGRSQRFSETLGKQMMYLAIAIRQDGSVLAVIRTSQPLTEIDKRLDDIYKKFFWASVLIAVIAAVVSLVVSKRMSRPVEQMTKTARLFASGDLTQRLSIPATDELAGLAKALNEMAQQLSDKIDAITEDRNRTQAILSSMIEAVLAVDLDGRIIGLNEAAADFLNIEPAKGGVIGRNLEEIVRNPDIQKFIQNTLQGDVGSAEADTFLVNDGEKFLELHGTPLTDNKGNRSGAVIVMHDITRIKRLEQVRRDFVANVSHELKTPITSIKGFVETLQEGALDDPGQAKRFLEIISKHTDRLNSIVDDLLSLSRLEETSEKRRISLENTLLKPVLFSSIELSKFKAEKKNITVELDCDSDLTAKINTALIEQAVLNLIDNAIKYSPDNSKILVSALKIDAEVLISVSDQGCGIEEEHLDRIFERFYVVDKSRSRKLGGTGLGLSIVKHIAQVHAGLVTVESKINVGSTFKIHLPVETDSNKNA
jgi:two-component system phosphate regulon sensor histidine kinase PhoR